MPEADNSSGGSNTINIASFVALLLLIGGVLFVQQKLTSSRPASPNVLNDSAIDTNFVQARLWEDPLKWATNVTDKPSFERLQQLRDELRSHSDGTNVPTILAVMIHGGTYSEDYESRLRSRYAVVSALGTRGYYSEMGTTIGTALVPWRTEQGWATWITNGYFECQVDCQTQCHAGDDWPKALPLSFEWYRLNTFAYRVPQNLPERVFVIWINEDYLQRKPLVKLAWLFDQLLPEQPDGTNRVQKIALVGPRRSETLQEMLPPYEPCDEVLTNKMCGGDKQWLRGILGRVDVYCATAGVMDELLVHTNCDTPRQTIKDVLSSSNNPWFSFKSFNNFSVTASQLAQETYDELKLRDIDVCDQHKHVVVLSEWDTFYGRTFPLAFAAELATKQSSYSNSTYRPPVIITNRLHFIDQWRYGSNYWPENLYRIRYLRGLDGQSSGASSAQGATICCPAKHKTAYLNERNRSTPDENKAIGPSQFDYLTRLGDLIKDIQNEIRNTNGGRIDAIGIGGSDVYDVLLILQALRPRFPEAVFFTTDIDARFADPDEQSWARNLIVVSGYGLQLHPGLQRRIAPFRDSSQTAEFAAVLGALGDPIVQDAKLEPRRFQVIRNGIEDLSTSTNSLYPPPRAFQNLSIWKSKLIAGLLLILGSGCLLSSIYVLPLRKVTWEHHRNEGEALWLREEDIGGKVGTAILMSTLGSSSDSFAEWLKDQLTDARLHDPQEKQEPILRLVLDCLNRQVLQNSIPERVVTCSSLITPEAIREFEQARLERQDDRGFSRNSVQRLKANRLIVHEALKSLLEPSLPKPNAGAKT
jgi:hypothetical protein